VASVNEDEQRREDRENAAIKRSERRERNRTLPFLAVVLLSFVILVLVFRDVGDVRNLSQSNRMLITRLAGDEARLANVTKTLATQGETHRKQIAASDLQLCTKLYGQVVQLEKNSAATATVAIYHRLLPSIPLSDIRNLVRSAQAGALRVERQFDPAQCHQLPSQKITKAKIVKP
jgi:hypothetical protein